MTEPSSVAGAEALSKLVQQLSEALPVPLWESLASLPPVLDAHDVARLLRVDAKVVYAAVTERGLPLRLVGRRKCLRGLTVAILLWLLNEWPPTSGLALSLEDQGRAVSKRKRRQ